MTLENICKDSAVKVADKILEPLTPLVRSNLRNEFKGNLGHTLAKQIELWDNNENKNIVLSPEDKVVLAYHWKSRNNLNLSKILSLSTARKGTMIRAYLASQAIETGKDAEQIRSEVRAVHLYHHYNATVGPLDPEKLLSSLNEKKIQLKIPLPLQTNGYGVRPNTIQRINIALQYSDRIDTTDKALKKLIRNVVRDPSKGRLTGAIYLLDKLESYTKTKDEITRDLYIKTLRYNGFIDGEYVRSESVRSHPVVNGERTPLKMAKPFQHYVPGNTRQPNALDKLMMAYDIAIKEGFKCEKVLATENHLKKIHKAYGMEGVKAWYHFNLHVNRDEFSDQSKNWIAEISEEEEGVLD